MPTQSKIGGEVAALRADLETLIARATERSEKSPSAQD
jgi:hypothetical protein